MIHENDLTVGAPSKLLFRLAMPILFGSLIQQAYTLVDTAILGKYVNTEALTAVSCTSWIYWLIMGVFTGFTQGFSILISQYYGANDYQNLKRSIAMSCLHTLILSILVTVLSLCCIHPLLLLLKTPINIIALSERYLLIVSSGTVVIAIYNLLSSILRAVGDTKTGFFALIIASIINICLDILFVIWLKAGVTGVAVATVIAQGISCLVCLHFINQIAVVRIHISDCKFDKDNFNKLFRLGFPLTLQNIIISAGGLILQGIVNSYGFLFTSAVSLTGKVTTLLQQGGVAFSTALGTYVGQNLGAHKLERIKVGVNKCLKINFIVSITIGLLFILIGKPVIAFFLSGDPAASSTNGQIIKLAYEYLIVECIFLVTVYLLFTYRAALLGMGQTFFPMFSGIMELIFRLVAAALLPIWIGRNGIFFADALAWMGAGILLLISYNIKIRET